MDQHLQVFVTVVERESFSQAAEVLLMTQPAVSQYIRTFEENIGARLLERSNKYVRLTKAGEIVYTHAKEIIGAHTRMQTMVDDLSNHASGPISIGASFTFGEYVLPHIIAKMSRNHPEIQPTITIGNTKEIANYIADHQLDVGITEGYYANEEQLYIDNFAEDAMVIVVAADHALAKTRNPIKLSALQEERWLLREKGSGTREATDKVFKKFNMLPDQTMTFGSTQAIKEAVQADLGISFLSKWAIQRELRSGDLYTVPVEGLPFTRQFSIVTASPYQTKAQEVFVELLHSSKEITNFKLT